MKKNSKVIRYVISLLLLISFLTSFYGFSVNAASMTLSNCDSVTGWSTDAGNTLSIDTVNKIEGTGSLSTVGSGTVKFAGSFSTSVNTGINQEYGILQLWIYISDLSKFNGPGQIEISSSGTSDNNEYSWNTEKFVNPNLKTGWNILTLRIREATRIGSPNLSSINWFRYYQPSSGSVTYKIDNIKFNTLNTVPLDACESADGWSSNNTLSIDGNDLRYGTASLVSTGSGTVFFQKTFSTPYNTATNERYGKLHFDLYVSDVTKLASGQIEITSSGTSDTNEYGWDMQTQVIPYLINGWNSIDLRISTASKIGDPDLSAINWFRLYNFATSGLTMKIDNISLKNEFTPVTILDSCDSTDSWYSNNLISLDTVNQQVGTGSISQTGSGIIQMQKQFLTPVNSNVPESYGYLQFWYYISDITAFDIANGEVEISSSGTYDSNEYAWKFWDYVKPDLHNGWNLVQLKFSSSIKTGSPNLGAINWFRIYQSISKSVTTKVDNIVFVKDNEFQTLYPTKTTPSITPHPQTFPISQASEDVNVAMYSVTDFGASTANNDNTVQFQNAINDTYNAGGGVIFVPQGQWNIRGHLLLRENVTLRGDWKNPESGGLGQGTILKAYDGRDNENSYAFISLENGALVRDLTVWYPEQSDINIVHAYPWTFRNAGTTGAYAPYLKNITLINSYNGIKVDSNNNAAYFKNIYGTALKRGIYHDGSWDIGKAHSVWLRPKYWANSGLGTPPTEVQIESYTNANATAITLYKNDWGVYYDLFLEGYNKGIEFKKSLVVTKIDFGYNGTFENFTIKDGTYGIYADFIMPDNSVMFSNGNISVAGAGACVKTTGNFTGTQTLSFNSCTFSAPAGVIVDQAGSGVLNFVKNNFNDWSPSNKAINAAGGSLLIQANYFNADKPDISLGSGVSSAAVLLNSYAYNTPNISNSSTGDIKIDTLTGSPADYDSMPTTLPSLSTFRKPPNNNFFNVASYGAIGDGETDNTTAFQNALNAASSAGGGTVYVPAGRYKFNGHLSIAANVELRGVSDGPRHYGGTANRGTVLLPYENQNNVNGAPFITLGQNAGVRGLNIYYINQYFDNVQQYPPMIFSNSTGAYAINVVSPNAYYGIKFQNGDYYINYSRIFGLNTGIWIDGVSTAGYIINNLNTVGDWQDGYRDINACKTDLWMNWPTIAGSTNFLYSNASSVVNVGNFSFGCDYGIKISGNSSNNIFHGLAVDNSEYPIVFQNFTGTGTDFINAQLTSGGPNSPKFVYSDSNFTGAFRFFNAAAWGYASTGIEINGAGTARFQQWKQTTGNVDFKGGNCYLDSSAIYINPNQVNLQTGLSYARVFGSMGNASGFGVNNYKNAPDVWMNIRR